MGVSQKELSRQCDLSQAALSQIENNVKRPTQKTIEKVCTVLDIPQAVIFIIAIEETDVSENKREIYKLVYPPIVSLTLQMIKSDVGV